MGKQILLVEDNETFADYLRIILEKAGYHVFWALDDIGVKNALQLGVKPDAIVVDLVLPGKKSGLEIVECFRNKPDYAAIPAILITGYYDILKRAQEMGDTRLESFNLILEKSDKTAPAILSELQERIGGAA